MYSQNYVQTHLSDFSSLFVFSRFSSSLQSLCADMQKYLKAENLQLKSFS